MVAIARVQANIAINAGSEAASPATAAADESPAATAVATTDAISSYVAVHGMHSGKTTSAADNGADLMKQAQELKKEAESMAETANKADSSNKFARLFGIVAARAEKAAETAHAAE